MPANVYECMFLLDTSKVAGDVPAAEKQLHTILERHHAEILVARGIRHDESVKAQVGEADALQ